MTTKIRGAYILGVLNKVKAPTSLKDITRLVAYYKDTTPRSIITQIEEILEQGVNSGFLQKVDGHYYSMMGAAEIFDDDSDDEVHDRKTSLQSLDSYSQKPGLGARTPENSTDGLQSIRLAGDKEVRSGSANKPNQKSRRGKQHDDMDVDDVASKKALLRKENTVFSSNKGKPKSNVCHPSIESRWDEFMADDDDDIDEMDVDGIASEVSVEDSKSSIGQKASRHSRWDKRVKHEENIRKRSTEGSPDKVSKRSRQCPKRKLTSEGTRSKDNVSPVCLKAQKTRSSNSLDELSRNNRGLRRKIAIRKRKVNTETNHSEDDSDNRSEGSPDNVSKRRRCPKRKLTSEGTRSKDNISPVCLKAQKTRSSNSLDELSRNNRGLRRKIANRTRRVNTETNHSKDDSDNRSEKIYKNLLCLSAYAKSSDSRKTTKRAALGTKNRLSQRAREDQENDLQIYNSIPTKNSCNKNVVPPKSKSADSLNEVTARNKWSPLKRRKKPLCKRKNSGEYSDSEMNDEMSSKKACRTREYPTSQRAASATSPSDSGTANSLDEFESRDKWSPMKSKKKPSENNGETDDSDINDSIPSKKFSRTRESPETQRVASAASISDDSVNTCGESDWSN